MKVGIIGGGLMGLTLAYALAGEGHYVTVLEQAANPGGMNADIMLDDGLSIPRFQHPILPHDGHVHALYAEMGMADDLLFTPVQTGFIHSGRVYNMSTLRDFMRFAPLGLRDRLMLARTLMTARKMTNWRMLDRIPARDWLTDTGGPSVFEHIWAPLLEAKFDGLYGDIPATYIWSWLNRMTTTRRLPQFQAAVAVPRRGHCKLIGALTDAVRARGGTIMTGARVREIEVSQGELRQVRTHSDILTFDALIAAVPTPDFAKLIPGADEFYLAALGRSRYQGLICPALVVDRSLSPYWTLNLTDPSSPFSSIVEVPHPMDPQQRVVYLPKYTAPDSDWMGVRDDEIRDAWLLRLRQIFPQFQESAIRHFVVSRSRYADPVHSLGAADTLLPVETPYTGLYLANVSQVYPDLATSEAVIAHARHVARIVMQQRERLHARTAA